MKVRKMMKTIGILVLLVGFLYGFFYLSIRFIRMWNDGDFIGFMPSYIKEKNLSEKYGGVYVFYPEFREEIKKREGERKEEKDKLIAIAKKEANKIVKEKYGFTDEDIKRVNAPQGDYFEDKQYNEVWREVTKQVYAGFEEKYPQTLSNGCKYHNQAFGPYREYFEPYYEKIKEFVGEGIYEKEVKSALRTTSFYECGDGKKVPITIWTQFGTTYKKFGLFGDEGAGFSLTETEGISIGGSNTFELRDGKFVKVDKKYEGWD